MGASKAILSLLNMNIKHNIPSLYLQNFHIFFSHISFKYFPLSVYIQEEQKCIQVPDLVIFYICGTHHHKYILEISHSTSLFFKKDCLNTGSYFFMLSEDEKIVPLDWTVQLQLYSALKKINATL